MVVVSKALGEGGRHCTAAVKLTYHSFCSYVFALLALKTIRGPFVVVVVVAFLLLFQSVGISDYTLLDGLEVVPNHNCYVWPPTRKCY